jgi:hypothetical protein
VFARTHICNRSWVFTYMQGVYCAAFEVSSEVILCCCATKSSALSLFVSCVCFLFMVVVLLLVVVCFHASELGMRVQS